MKQLSLVAFYGEKERPLAELVDHCRSVVAESSLEETFTPYRTAQVHATITGMESLPGEPPCNRNVWSKRGVEARMEFSRLAEVLGRHLPMSIRLGGFDPGDCGFKSRGLGPYERSFQIHPATGKLTLVGWPHLEGDFEPRLLERLRSDLAEACNIEHKYDGDNDLYLVLGTVEPAAVAGDVSTVEATVRDHLLRHPLDIRLGLADAFIVRYEEETLERASTTAYVATDPGLSPGYLRALYDS